MRRSARGVTLLELVLVLAVLLILTGITVSLYPDLARRSAITASLSSINELANAIQMYEALTGEMPNGLDSLVDTSVATTLISMRTSVDPSNFVLTTIGDLESTLGLFPVGVLEATFLSRGLTSLSNYSIAGASATFFPDSTVGVTAASDIVTIALGAVSKFGLPPLPASEAYVVFGMGSSCSMVGSAPGILSAPVHTSHVPTENDFFLDYSRYLVVYKVGPDGLGGAVISFATVLAPTEFGSPSEMGTADNYTALRSTL